MTEIEIVEAVLRNLGFVILGWFIGKMLFER